MSLDELEQLYTRSEQWDEVVEVYRRKVDLSADANERRQLMIRRATILEERLGDVEQATHCYAEALAQGGGTDVDVLKALDRLYQLQGAWRELADNLSRQLMVIKIEDEALKVDLLVRLASLRENELSDVAAAIETYREVLQLDPSDEVAVLAIKRLTGPK